MTTAQQNISPQLLFQHMCLIRYFEQAVQEQVNVGNIPGAVHLSLGQEGVVVGACSALQQGDTVFGSHRSHGYPLALGADPTGVMAEIMGRVGGLTGGRGGSMHLSSPNLGLISESAIVGGGIPLATGAGLTAQVLGNGHASMCFFGDGAVNQGTFHESLNMASLWHLPVVYVCENNLYAATTPLVESHGQQDIAKRAEGYGMVADRVDGQQVLEVYGAVSKALVRARKGQGPTLLDIRTYRYDEHASGLYIPADYRSQDEISTWQQRDPLVLFRHHLVSESLADEATLKNIESQVEQQVQNAVEGALGQPQPDVSSVGDYVYPA